MRQPSVEILYFDGCPHHESCRANVERIGAELDLEPNVRLIEVADADAAADLKFLGSPTIRIDGHDVEPGADERRSFVFSCRVYGGTHGFSGVPEETWIRDALAHPGG